MHDDVCENVNLVNDVNATEFINNNVNEDDEVDNPSNDMQDDEVHNPSNDMHEDEKTSSKLDYFLS